MKRRTLFLLWCVLWGAPLWGQSIRGGLSAERAAAREEHFSWHHQSQFGVGVFALNPFRWQDKDAVLGSPAPIFSLQYLYRIKNGFQLGVSVSASRSAVASAAAGYRNDTQLSVQLDVRWHYYTSRWVTLYGSVGAGLAADAKDVVPLAAFSPIGATVGRKLYGFVECGAFGARGLVHGGIGYRF